MTDTSKAIIEFKNVSRMYGFGEATTVALDNVNLKVEKGEFIAIMGRSGSGKSTLMNVIGLLDNPTHGTYLLNGHHLSELTERDRSKLRLSKIGFIFQSSNLLPKMSAIDNVALPLAYSKTPIEKRLKKASKLLAALGLQEREYYKPNQLSGGQIQRVAIARALINKPDIILADEPTGNLDSVTSENIMNVLSDLHKAGNTIIMVTHDANIAKYATRMIRVSDGRIVIDEETTDQQPEKPSEDEGHEAVE